MTIRFRCSGCSVVLTTATRKPGDEVRCPRCQQSQLIPSSESDRKSLFAPTTETEGTLSELKSKFSENLFEKAPPQEFSLQTINPEKPTRVVPKPPPLPSRVGKDLSVPASTSSSSQIKLPNQDDSLEDLDELKKLLPTEIMDRLKILILGAKLIELLEKESDNNTIREFIPENQIKLEKIESIFEKASIITINLNNNFGLLHINRVLIVIIINDEYNTILLKWFHKFRARMSGVKKLRMLNYLNNEFMFARFSIPEDNEESFLADYCLSYDGGLYAHQIVDSVKLFYSCISKILGDVDNEELLDD